jgi:uncharacterized membrane protein
VSHSLLATISKGEHKVNLYTIIAIALIVLGVLGLAYGQFSYTKDSETADLGPIELTFNEKETVNIPVWAGAGSIAVGAVMLVVALVKR